MKWIPIEKARGLEIDKPVLVKDKENYINFGKLVKIEKTVEGTKYTFELAQFSYQGEMAINMLVTVGITHVAIP